MAQLKDTTIDGVLSVNGVSVNDALDNSIVAQGTSGVWTYRKWNNGIAECWGKHAVSTPIATVFGTYFVESSSIQLPDFPFTFTEIPVAQYSFSGSKTATLETANPKTTNGGITWLYRPAGSPITTNVTGDIAMYVIGKWK